MDSFGWALWPEPPCSGSNRGLFRRDTSIFCCCKNVSKLDCSSCTLYFRLAARRWESSLGSLRWGSSITGRYTAVAWRGQLIWLWLYKCVCTTPLSKYIWSFSCDFITWNTFQGNLPTIGNNTKQSTRNRENQNKYPGISLGMSLKGTDGRSKVTYPSRRVYGVPTMPPCSPLSGLSVS